jgi:hypothetical protein
MGRGDIFYAFLLLVEIEGHLTHEFVTCVYETQDRENFDTGTCISSKKK